MFTWWWLMSMKCIPWERWSFWALNLNGKHSMMIIINKFHCEPLKDSVYGHTYTEWLHLQQVQPKEIGCNDLGTSWNIHTQGSIFSTEMLMITSDSSLRIAYIITQAIKQFMSPKILRSHQHSRGFTGWYIHWLGFKECPCGEWSSFCSSFAASSWCRTLHPVCIFSNPPASFYRSSISSQRITPPVFIEWKPVEIDWWFDLGREKKCVVLPHLRLFTCRWCVCVCFKPIQNAWCSILAFMAGVGAW